MKYSITLLILTAALNRPALGQASTAQHTTSETKGVCSPIAPDNKGTITITCSGFSEKQSQQILDFLKQLSSEQAKDQDVLLQKLNEIMNALKTAQRQANPRKITDEAASRILHSAWGICAQIPILVVAPSGDDEAGSLAVQLVNLFSRAGRLSRVEYVPQGQTIANTDVIIADQTFDPCPLDYMTLSGAPLNFSISSGTQGGPGCDGKPVQLPRDTKLTLVYVCRK